MVSRWRVIEAMALPLQRRQQDLEKQIGESRRSQQYWLTQERQRRQRLESKPKPVEPDMKPVSKPDTSLDFIPIP